MIYNRVLKEITEKIEEQSGYTNWKDWNWQLEHSIRSVNKFEYLPGIKFQNSEKAGSLKTFQKSPFLITPYYLSRINKINYKNDTVFKQPFGNIESINIYYKHI